MRAFGAQLAVGFIWVGSLFVPAIKVGTGTSAYGWELLISGWRGWEAGVVAWYANPLFWAALLASARRLDRLALALSGTAALLALTSFTAPGVVSLVTGVSIPKLAFLQGFFLWLAAPAGLWAWSWGRVRVARPRLSGRRHGARIDPLLPPP
jgi:hypothetical protein